jgi:glycosyltransferase involved in cell wall biosynthesis
MRKIVFNGKFRAQRMTGVQRVAEELITALGTLKLSDPSAYGDLDLNWAPPRGAALQSIAGVNQIDAGRQGGILWEQLELPATAGSSLLVNLCNVGPLVRRGDVLMIHDAQAFLSPQSYAKAFVLYYQTLLPRLARRASRVLTVSPYARAQLAKARIAPLEAITVIPNGVDHILRCAPDDAVLDALGLLGRAFVLAPASVQAHKNIKVLLKAAASFQDDLRLVLYGAASRADFAAAGLHVPDAVILTGRIEDGALRSLMQAALAFAFPSLTEGFGLPPLEAMLLGAPAILAEDGPMPDLCADAAVYVASDDPAAWAGAISRMKADDAHRAAVSAAGRAQAQTYTWAKSAKALADVLRETA